LGPQKAVQPSDVLLIADEPKRSADGRIPGPGRLGETTGIDGRVEPLDMESVVRRLIALLSEETQP
jgi:hypothetical protein